MAAWLFVASIALMAAFCAWVLAGLVAFCAWVLAGIARMLADEIKRKKGGR